MPLSMMQVGQKGRVLRISGPEATRKHLGSLGFVPGGTVQVVCALNDNLIIAIHDSRIAINGGTANHVFVEAV
jgi:ferrous iron transport protein A